jgi:hypothetical protein
MVTKDLMDLAVRNLPARLWHGLAEWVRTALGNMAAGEFWLKLFETIVKQMVNAFLITLGGKLLTYGVSREDPDVKNTTRVYGGMAAPASSAFSGSSVRPDFATQYAPRTPSDYRSQAVAEYRAPSVPPRAPLDSSFPAPFSGFGDMK